MKYQKKLSELLCQCGFHNWIKEMPKPLLIIFGLHIEIETMRLCSKCNKKQKWIDTYDNVNKLGYWEDVYEEK